MIIKVAKIDGSVPELLAKLPNSCGYAKQLQQFGSTKRQREWLASRVLLQEMLNGAHKEIVYNERGVPMLSDGSYNISISHTKEYVAIILSADSRVGIDIEMLAPQGVEATARHNTLFRILTPQEQAFLSPKDKYTHATICWCAKETIFKVSSVKLITDIELHPFEYANSGTITPIVPSNVPHVSYELHSNYVLTYASTNN